MKYSAVGGRHPVARPLVFWSVLAALVLVGATTPAFAQCTFANGFGSATIAPTGAVVMIFNCSFAGEYVTINGAVSGQTLQFTSSGATDFITIHSGTADGPVLAFGASPLTFANTFTGTLFAHWAADAACAAQFICRITTVQCMNCPVIYVNGPIATGATSRSGVAAPAGTQWSEVSNDLFSTTATNTTTGFGCQRVGVAMNNRCADDFIVPAGDTFTITKVIAYAYQFNYSGVPSPVIDANVQIWNGRPGDPGAVVVAGNPTSLPFMSVNVPLYRISNSGPPSNTSPVLTRRIWENTITLAAPAVLTPGTYWVDFQIDAGALGNFTPPVTFVGFRTVPGWNGRQFLTGSGWLDLLDVGNPLSEPDVAQDLPFQLVGTRSLIFVDGFAAGTTAAWSLVVP